MKHNQSVEMNHSTKTVILTKKFLLAANRIGTPEFNEMMTLRTQFADYTFEEREIKKNPNKQTYGRLTYAAMKDYIKGKETKERAEIILAELDTVIDLSQAQKASYTNYTFSMYGGEIEHVTLQFQNRLMNAVIDRFGTDIHPRKVDKSHFEITVPVAVSQQFFGWLFGLGKMVRIVGPESVRQQMQKALLELGTRYEEEARQEQGQ